MNSPDDSPSADLVISQLRSRIGGIEAAVLCGIVLPGLLILSPLIMDPHAAGTGRMLGCFALAGGLLAFLLISLRELMRRRASLAEDAHGLRIISVSGADATWTQLWRRWLLRRGPLVVLMVCAAVQGVVSARTPNHWLLVEEAAGRMFRMGAAVGGFLLLWIVPLVFGRWGGRRLDETWSGTKLGYARSPERVDAGVSRGPGAGARIAAAAVDAAMFGLCIAAGFGLLMVRQVLRPYLPIRGDDVMRLQCTLLAVLIILFVAVEVAWGCTPGKWLLGLVIAHRTGVPALPRFLIARALLRRLFEMLIIVLLVATVGAERMLPRTGLTPQLFVICFWATAATALIPLIAAASFLISSRSLVDHLSGTDVLYRRDVRTPEGGRAGFDAITIAAGLGPLAAKPANIPAPPNWGE